MKMEEKGPSPLRPLLRKIIGATATQTIVDEPQTLDGFPVVFVDRKPDKGDV